ncbi:MAG: hypothetical protein AUJ98_06145 [Bacteroidetes bacterium CG2_30_33_31]|nr:MAG: hypothetical protein AUJ98_06145 [Bacteroidetes bacterium CG2_30_33_31]
MKLEGKNIPIKEGDIEMILRKLDNLKTILENQVGKRRIDINKKTLLGTDQAANYLGISRTELYRLTGKGKISFTKIGGRRKYTLADLDKYLEGEYHPVKPSII